ncbi:MULTISPECIES: GNAT family N-acetyltransferase [Maribacter]|uniref:GNAT family N-acetyltransferase n=1 Tax=Maribacter flavus TaxID=1658664 RepID=A0A5B2TYB6_9FLAO|nr:MULTISPECIES: GNAT family N-acetyltransferase [Maribacter]KAA2219289.1 GNAT family N-acetyltransferase [Maribacter flavus]MDC6404227.1 GNAT family N-acetyltransferase [Maribacter sp. PR66]MEE1971370.1 GNAT family N-acetyltransferase [Maribacter flavus]
MNTSIKRFNELDTSELYAILQLRSEVFVVEQSCVYQDLDGKDAKALHVIGKKAGEIVAYTRVFAPGDYFAEASIGRVVVKQSQRKYGYGKVIMEASIKAVEEELGTKTIRISAQTYLLKFYNSLGFKAEGPEYLEDGIPHVSMVRGK